MIDTVRFKVFMAVKEPRAIIARGGWKVQRLTGREVFFSDGREFQQEEFTQCQHEESGLRAAWKGLGMGEVVVEVSLPRALYGNNGQVLQDDTDIDAALHRVRQLLDELGAPMTFKDGEVAYVPEYSRVDLVWQFEGSPAAWIVAHANGSHPWVRKTPQQFFGETLTFQGKEVGVCIYDKELEVNGKPGNVVRVEVRLKGKRLKESLGEYWQDDKTRLHVLSLPFRRCWQVYRSACVAFEPKDLVQLPERLAAGPLYALLAAHDVRIEGVPVLDLVRAQFSRATWYRVKKKAGEYRATYTGVRWHDLLPESGPAVEAPEVLKESKSQVQAAVA